MPYVDYHKICLQHENDVSMPYWCIPLQESTGYIHVLGTAASTIAEFCITVTGFLH